MAESRSTNHIDCSPRWRVASVILLAASWAVGMGQPRAFAQVAAGPTSNPVGSVAGDPQDTKLMYELANRGMTSLLEYYFQKYHVPEEQRRQFLMIVALKSLDEPQFAARSESDRAKEIENIVNNINDLLPGVHDPQQLIRYSAALTKNGADPLISNLEYWGEDPKTQAMLHPIAQSIDKILRQAVDEPRKKADVLLNQIKLSDDPRAKQWEELNQISNFALFMRARAAYGLAISYDHAAPPRAEICKQAISELDQFDFDGGPAQVPSELSIGKLYMAEGGDEAFAAAKKYFQKVIDRKDDDKSKPSPFLQQDYEARYFTVVTDVLSHKLSPVDQDLSDLKTWQSESMPADKATQQSLAANLALLEYRIDMAKAEEAPNAQEKEQFNSQAISVLVALVNEQPNLRRIIFDLVMSRLPQTQDLTKLDPLLLEGLFDKGVDLALKKTATAAETHQMELAIGAAREIIRRNPLQADGNSRSDRAAFLLGALEQYLGENAQLPEAQRRNHKFLAVESYLDYVQRFITNTSSRKKAMDQAMGLLTEMRQSDHNDDRLNSLYDHALDLGMNKMGMTDLAYEYATRRRELGDYAAAKTAYALVQSNQIGMKIDSLYYQMYCDKQLLDHAAGASQKTDLSQDIQRLADQLNPRVQQAIEQTTDPKNKAGFQLYRVESILMAADVARANKNPARALQLLDNFEKEVSLLSQDDQNARLGDALFQRVNALISLGRSTEAISEIHQLVQKDPRKALETVDSLVRKLNESFIQERGKEHPDESMLNLLSQQRAQMSELLVEQAQKNTALPTEYRQKYLQFSAKAQLDAARLQTDPANRRKFLDQAMKAFQGLIAGLNPSDPAYPGLQRDIALTEFEMGNADNLQKAHDILNDLFAAKQFGLPLMRVGDESKMNDVYSEGLLRLLQAKVKLAEIHRDVLLREEAERILKNYVIQFGDQAGGEAYGKDFRALRKELLGNWSPTDDVLILSNRGPTTSSSRP